jgi:hypothetical protein
VGDSLCDEGVESPSGVEYTVLARGRGFPVIGRTLPAMILFRNQYEVRVDSWPRKLRRKAIWSTIVTGPEAEVLCNHLVHVIEEGEWTPGLSELPPPAH